MLKGLGGLGDMAKMMKAAQEMQARMAEMQDTLGTINVEGQAGGGLVRATASARGELKGLSIDPSLLRPDDREMVEDLILAAVQNAQTAANQRMAEEMRKVTDGLGLPPGAMPNF